MNFKSLACALGLFFSLPVFAQPGWSVCPSPSALNRVDDIYMLNTTTGYAVSGTGKIMKTTDGVNWNLLIQRPLTYFRSVEFVSDQKGFVGGFPNGIGADSILLTTNDGGVTWTDLTPRLDVAAQSGICGLDAPDANTIYGCGNWYETSAYIVKSADGGNTWRFIDMSGYATSLIDMHFINKDVGFAVGRGPAPLMTAVVLYTTDGGQSWTYKFKNTVPSEYCWKIQAVNRLTYFGSIEDDNMLQPTQFIKSTDGGMTWQVRQVTPRPGVFLQGIGFIDNNLGWAGGHNDSTFESADGGLTWKRITACPVLNRIFRVNDTLLYGTGLRIWRYSRQAVAPAPVTDDPIYASIKCTPNPASNQLNIRLKLKRPTHSCLALLNNAGQNILVIDNTNRPDGVYDFTVPVQRFSPGTYMVVLKTHEDKQVEKVLISH